MSFNVFLNYTLIALLFQIHKILTCLLMCQQCKFNVVHVVLYILLDSPADKKFTLLRFIFIKKVLKFKKTMSVRNIFKYVVNMLKCQQQIATAPQKKSDVVTLRYMIICKVVVTVGIK